MEDTCIIMLITACHLLYNINGSYNLENDLNFSSRLKKSLNLVLEQYLTSQLGLEKSFKFSTLCTPSFFSDKLSDC